MCLAGSIVSSSRPLLLTLGLLAFGFAAVGQNVPPLEMGAEPDNCPPAPDPNSGACLTLDARASVDTLGEPVILRWQMGDGQIREGVRFDYCYARRGRYTIRLDVVNKRTGNVSPGELERTVDLSRPPAALRFQAPARAVVGDTVTFELQEQELPGCVGLRVRFNWNFRDGWLAQGRRVRHAFRRPGTYVIRLAIDGTGIGPDCIPQTCVSQPILIEEKP